MGPYWAFSPPSSCRMGTNSRSRKSGSTDIPTERPCREHSAWETGPQSGSPVPAALPAGPQGASSSLCRKSGSRPGIPTSCGPALRLSFNLFDGKRAGVCRPYQKNWCRVSFHLQRKGSGRLFPRRPVAFVSIDKNYQGLRTTCCPQPFLLCGGFSPPCSQLWQKGSLPQTGWAALYNFSSAALNSLYWI